MKMPLEYFVSDILPLIHAEIPEARFWAVGRKPSNNLTKLSAISGVNITGTVDDIRPYLATAGAYIVPMRSGSGTRLKVFEAMAAGKAVVSTSIGAEGLPVTSWEGHIDSRYSFCVSQAVASGVRNSDLRERLGSAARALTEHRFSWAAATREFEDILCRVAGRSMVTCCSSKRI